MPETSDILKELHERFGTSTFHRQETKDEFPTLWVSGKDVFQVLDFLKNQIPRPYQCFMT